MLVKFESQFGVVTAQEQDVRLFKSLMESGASLKMASKAQVSALRRLQYVYLIRVTNIETLTTIEACWKIMKISEAIREKKVQLRPKYQKTAVI